MILNSRFRMLRAGFWAGWLSGLLLTTAVMTEMAIALTLSSPAQAQTDPAPEDGRSPAELLVEPLADEAPVESNSDLSEILSYEFVSESSGFSVLMPGPPVEQAFPLLDEIEEGRIFVQIRIEDESALTIYFAGYADYVGDLSTPEAIETALTGFVLSFAQEGEIQSQRRLSLSDYPGVEVEVASPNELSLSIMRGYVVEQRFFFTGLFVNPFAFFGGTAAPIVEPPATATPFLDSFQLL